MTKPGGLTEMTRDAPMSDTTTVPSSRTGDGSDVRLAGENEYERCNSDSETSTTKTGTTSVVDGGAAILHIKGVDDALHSRSRPIGLYSDESMFLLIAFD